MWKRYVKDVLLLFIVSCILSTSVAVTFIAHGAAGKGLIILFIAAFLGLTTESLQHDYWHKRGIDATPLGFIAAWLFFIAGIVWLWRYDFFFWVPLALVAALILWGYVTAKNKRPAKPAQ